MTAQNDGKSRGRYLPEYQTPRRRVRHLNSPHVPLSNVRCIHARVCTFHVTAARRGGAHLQAPTFNSASDTDTSRQVKVSVTTSILLKFAFHVRQYNYRGLISSSAAFKAQSKCICAFDPISLPPPPPSLSCCSGIIGITVCRKQSEGPR